MRGSNLSFFIPVSLISKGIYYNITYQIFTFSNLAIITANNYFKTTNKKYKK